MKKKFTIRQKGFFWGLFLVVLIINIAMGIFFIGQNKESKKKEGQTSSQDNEQIKTTSEEFCGFSTYGECKSDKDCQAGGCSGQVCRAKNEEERATTCEYRSCYNAERYQKRCSCFEDRCQWR
ncbi:eight-cysteine-cluster domain-containing protein [Candidatus Shapirobacteria bacterium]|nr:eight-cysteine-cluster domain-containing protein [Candidatus Shapirobacteria bacterium]